MKTLSIPPQQMDLAIAVVSAILTPPILEQRRAFTAKQGRDPSDGEMEQLAQIPHLCENLRYRRANTHPYRCFSRDCDSKRWSA